MASTAPSCACGRSLAVICAIAAAGATAGLLAQRACEGLGGRLGEAGWACERSGAPSSLWSLVGVDAGLLSLLAGLLAYLAVAAVGRRHGW